MNDADSTPPAKKPLMRTNADLPEKHTVIFDGDGVNISEQVKNLARAHQSGDAMAQRNLDAVIRYAEQREVPFFMKIKNPSRTEYQCHPATWRGMSAEDKARFERVAATNGHRPNRKERRRQIHWQ
jgi:hypothetical protein